MAGQIEYIRTFLQVAASGGFSQAARATGLSPTIITRHIASLETDLGVQLFTRTTRKVDLTDAGRLYRARMVDVIAALEAGNAAVRQRQIGLSGPLRISAPVSFGTRFLPSVIAQFRTLHPAVQIYLHVTDSFVDIAGEGFDLALRISAPPPDLTTIWQKICPVPRVIVAAPGYLDRHAPITDPAELTDHQCLKYANGKDRTVWSFHQGATQRRVMINPCFSGNNGDIIAELAILGEGVAVLPLFIVEQALQAGQLRQILNNWHPPEIWLTTTIPPYTELPAKVAAFTRFVESALAI